MGIFDYLKAEDINAGVEECRRTAGAVLLDVREADEYAHDHIAGSINVPLSAIETAAERFSPDTPLFVYCLRGSRSKRAVEVLRSLGFTCAKSIGGILRYKGKIETK